MFDTDIVAMEALVSRLQYDPNATGGRIPVYMPVTVEENLARLIDWKPTDQESHLLLFLSMEDMLTYLTRYGLVQRYSTYRCYAGYWGDISSMPNIPDSIKRFVVERRESGDLPFDFGVARPAVWKSGEIRWVKPITEDLRSAYAAPYNRPIPYASVNENGTYAGFISWDRIIEFLQLNIPVDVKDSIRMVGESALLAYGMISGTYHAEFAVMGKEVFYRLVKELDLRLNSNIHPGTYTAVTEDGSFRFILNNESFSQYQDDVEHLVTEVDDWWNTDTIAALLSYARYHKIYDPKWVRYEEILLQFSKEHPSLESIGCGAWTTLVDDVSFEGDVVPSMEGLFGGIDTRGKWVTINNFPINWFSKKVEKAYKSVKLTRFYESIGMKIFGKGTIKVHAFFLPELIYLLDKLNGPRALRDRIVSETWLERTLINYPAIYTKKDRIYQEMDIKLYPHQEQFIDEYEPKKSSHMLHGSILSFDMGLGKTLTSLALMTALGKKTVVIIAPKSTLVNVWVDHIRRFYKTEQAYYVVGEEPTKVSMNTRFFIYNYESMDKLYDHLKFIKTGEDVGVIVDESHNFLRMQSNRTQSLIKLRQTLQCDDMLLMSGTPVKAMGVEIIPLLYVIDPWFDDEAREIFKNAFGVNTTVASDILHARMRTMMHRRTKDEVLTLPEKHEWTIDVKIKDGNKYTLREVKKAIERFVVERRSYHAKRMMEYSRDMEDVFIFLKATKIGTTQEFIRWQSIVETFHKRGFNGYDKRDVEDASWANAYERTTLVPLMTKPIRDKFRHSATAYKYVELKINGEVLGGLLTKLRAEMTSEMLRTVDLKQLVDESAKKTVFFTSFVDTVEAAVTELKRLGYKPVAIYGKTASEVPMLLKQFRMDPELNPLVATIQTLSTGVTLNEASRVVFLNQPFRQSDYLQASERVYRIGQDTEVDVIKLLLDTGGEPNLSTRMEDILSWSKEMSASIVDGRLQFHGVAHELLAEEMFGEPEANLEEAVPSMEALEPNSVADKRKRIIDKIVKVMNTLDPTQDNGVRYRTMLENMSDQEFSRFMGLIKSKKYQLNIIMPNMIKNIRIPDIFEAARLVNYEFMHHLWLPDPVSGKKFKTNEKYMVLDLPIRRAKQEVDKKRSVPEGDTKIDALTGQVTGGDRACSISTTEIRALQTRGLNKTMVELIRVRGGDVTAYGNFKRQLEESGEARLNDLDPSTRTTSSVIAGVLLKGMLLDNNL